VAKVGGEALLLKTGGCGQSWLVTTAANGHLEVERHLVKVEGNATDLHAWMSQLKTSDGGFSSLHSAASEGHVEVVRQCSSTWLRWVARHLSSRLSNQDAHTHTKQEVHVCTHIY
jgi:hypothetical protein